MKTIKKHKYSPLIRVFCLLAAFCLTTAGCGRTKAETSQPAGASSGTSAGESSAESSTESSPEDSGDSSAEVSADPSVGSSDPQETADPDPDKDKEVGSGVIVAGGDAAGQPLELGKTGKARISYTGNVSSAAYITSAAALPDCEGLEPYDDAYFKEHALVLVKESVPSGSIDVSIAAIDINGSKASVALAHETPGEDELATNDMATWLLWAEVEAGLDYQWTVLNPALQSDVTAY